MAQPRLPHPAFMPIRTLAVVLILSATCHAYPSAELAKAVAHCQSQPPEVSPFLRYLTAYNLPQEARIRAFRVASFVLNSVSNTRAISAPTQVNGSMIVVDLRQYCADTTRIQAWTGAWERMATRDYAFSLKTEAIPPGKTTPTTTRVAGGWLSGGDYTTLQSMTGSQQALMRLDQFLVLASSTTFGGEYYALAGINENEDEYFASIGIDVAAVNRLRAKHFANQFISGVTDKPRRIIRLQGILGGMYMTQDSEEVTAERDPLRYAVDQIDYDAGEFIAVGPNGMFQYSLFDADGNRQDVVPDTIAKDDSDPSGDGRLQPMISCVRCHVESGLKPFEDDQYGLLKSGVDFLSSDPTAVRKAAELYDPARLSRFMQFDRQTYDQAVLRTSGLSFAQASSDLASVYHWYRNRPVTLKMASKEVGLTSEEMKNALTNSRDPVILGLLVGKAVHRETWAASFAEAALAAETVRTNRQP